MSETTVEYDQPASFNSADEAAAYLEFKEASAQLKAAQAQLEAAMVRFRNASGALADAGLK